jgi:hypothetical protein
MQSDLNPNEIIEALIENNEMLDWQISTRHIDQIPTLTADSNNNVIFSLERHPHLFGRTSLGKESSAYINVEMIFEVNLISKKIILKEEKYGTIEINGYGLAKEDVDILWENQIFPELEDIQQLVLFKEKKEVEQYAEKAFRKFEWWEGFYITDFENRLPDNFKENQLKLIKEIFIDQVVDDWKRNKDDWKRNKDDWKRNKDDWELELED